MCLLLQPLWGFRVDICGNPPLPEFDVGTAWFPVGLPSADSLTTYVPRIFPLYPYTSHHFLPMKPNISDRNPAQQCQARAGVPVKIPSISSQFPSSSWASPQMAGTKVRSSTGRICWGSPVLILIPHGQKSRLNHSCRKDWWRVTLRKPWGTGKG